MQTQEKRLTLRRVVLNNLNRVVSDELGQIPLFFNPGVAVPQPVSDAIAARRQFVREVIDAAVFEAPEMVVATLERTVVRKISQMPFPEQRCPIASRLQDRGERGVIRRNTGSIRSRRQRLCETHRQPILIAPRDQRRARSRTHRRIRVRLQESRAARRDTVDCGRLILAPTVAGNISVPEVIRHDVNDVRLGRRLGIGRFHQCGKQRGCRHQQSQYGE